MKKILFLANCQGLQYDNFLTKGSNSYAQEWEKLKTIQVQSIRQSDATFILTQMQQADVIVAQPLRSTSIKEIRAPAIRSWTERMGKTLIVVPALQYNALTFGNVPTQWRSISDYPFAASENTLIAAAYVCGRSVRETVRLYHDAKLLSQEQLLARVEFVISAFQKREMEARADIIASEYYAQNWRKSRMHFSKGHPLPEVMRYFAAALAKKLGIEDFDPARTDAIKGNFGYCMPIPRWVKNGLYLEFESDHDTVSCGGTCMPLENFVKIMFEWYEIQGRDEVERRLAHIKPYIKARKAFA